MVTRPDQLLSIVYSSNAEHVLSDAELADLLRRCRQKNAQCEVTGMLLYRNGRFIQVIEGPEHALDELMDAIGADPRHRDVRVLLREDIDRRRFPEWTMGYESLSAVDAADIPGLRTSFADVEDDTDPDDTLGALRELTRWFQERGGRRD